MVDSNDVIRVLWYLRWQLAGLLLVLALFVHTAFAVAVAVGAGLCLIVLNGTHGFLKHACNTRLLVFFLLCADLLSLGVGLAVSGGVMNPLIGLMVVPLAIGAIALPWWLAAAMAGGAAGIYGVLTLWHLPLPLPHHGMTMLFHSHLFGMWGNFVLTSLLMVASVAWLSTRLVKQQQAIANMRDDLTRREAVIAVATEAAITSHEMSTPLATALMVADELGERSDLPAQASADVRLLTDQLHRCRNALRHIRRVADEARGQPAQAVDLASFITDVEMRFASLKPEARLDCSIDTTIDRRSIRVNARALSAALLNLLENAVESPNSDQAVALAVHLDDRWAMFDIRGNGVRAPTNVTDQAFPASSKTHGLGVGILLSHATVEQTGGQLIWSAGKATAGNRLRVRIPIQPPARINGVMEAAQ